jgi:rfaE bifunctional protein nucleotidyltransferase chain/domain
MISAKIFLEASDLKTVLLSRKEQGESIVFTNGCFDILHTGHTRYLQEARLAGDCLVIGVNSDESVARLKSEKRPIVPLADRMEVLAGLQFVNYVVPFNEDTPYNLINTIQPTVLVKGGDWPIDRIVGKDIVEENGGRVFTVPEIEGQATTQIIERIVERYR